MLLPTATIKSKTYFASKKGHLHVEGPGVNHPREDRGLVMGEGEAEGREEERGVGGKRVVGFARSMGEARGKSVGVGRHEQLRLSTPIVLLMPMPLRLTLVILNLHRRGGQQEGKC